MCISAIMDDREILYFDTYLIPNIEYKNIVLINFQKIKFNNNYSFLNLGI